MASLQIVACPARERLVADYRRLLAQYHVTFSGLLDVKTADEAIDEARPLFDACVSAREALLDHDRKDACGERRMAVRA